MLKKRFSAEQIVVVLRQMEVLMSQGKTFGLDDANNNVSRRERPMCFP